MYKVSENFASRVYRILNVIGGAPINQENDFVAKRNTFDEWRFQGKLGFGGKYYKKYNKVTCYKEDETPEILQLIEEINLKLKAILKSEIVYIDMDGVVADFNKEIMKVNPTIFEHENEEYCGNVIDQICEADVRIFERLELMYNAVEAVKKLDEHYTIYFLSTPMWNLPESFTDKRLWVTKHFGELATKRLILTHRKDLNIGSYLIDDRIKNGVDKFQGVHIHFGTTLFPDWNSVLHALIPE